MGGLEGGLGADLLAGHVRGEGFHDFAVLHEGLDDGGADQRSVVCDGVVEGEDLERRQRDFVADRHLGQRNPAPRIALRLAVHLRIHFAGQPDARAFAYAELCEGIEEGLRLRAKRFLHRQRRPDV